MMEGNVRDLITEISIHEETKAKLLSQFNELKLKVQDKQTNIKNEEEDLKELEPVIKLLKTNTWSFDIDPDATKHRAIMNILKDFDTP